MGAVASMQNGMLHTVLFKIKALKCIYFGRSQADIRVKISANTTTVRRSMVFSEDSNFTNFQSSEVVPTHFETFRSQFWSEALPRSSRVHVKALSAAALFPNPRIRGCVRRMRSESVLPCKKRAGGERGRARQRQRKSINTLVNESQPFTPRWAS